MPYAWLVAGVLPLAALAQSAPSFDELQAQGAVIGAITVETHNIFDLADSRENNRLFRLANDLHVTTRPWLVRRLLLFKEGDRVSSRLIDETERLIRASSSVYDVVIRPTRYENGVVDLEVRTRDTWTLQPGAKLSRAGGVTTGGFSLKDSNLAGTGTTLGIERTRDVERTGSHVQLAHEHLLDGWTSVSFDRASFNDGSSAALGLARPFYSLDTRWAAGGVA